MPALIELRGLGRDYPAGEGTISALRDVDFTICAGEMVAIMGPSGSGKSTLMNILGCLDRPTHGTYAVAGQQVGAMTPDELASLRREHFGFVFQRYQLLGAASAVGNVEIPAIYAGVPGPARHARARALLERLGLGDRLGHKPGQLSGGQQQRVSIARALMNGGDVILADEPTGALDRASGLEVMSILKELHAQGHTIILVTHDAQVAAHADRVIELSDGFVVRDERTREPAAPGVLPAKPRHRANPLRDLLARVAEATQMAIRAMTSHRLRTLLTMLGIIIGISSVVSIVALGEGSRQRLRNDLSAFGTNTISVWPSEGAGDRRTSLARPLTIGDADALGVLDYVDSVTPVYSASVTLRRGNVEKFASISGVGGQFFRVHGRKFVTGRAFDDDAVRKNSQVVVIDEASRKALFPDGVPALGAVILLGNMPVRIIGVVAKDEGLFTGFGSLEGWIPYTTATTRLVGQQALEQIIVRVSDSAPMDAAQEGITRLLDQRHGKHDVHTSSVDAFRKQTDKVTGVLTLLVSSIALISLVVGGIGVMNIMLVSVTERTQEIGVRMAVGARQGDILRQFLIEAVLVCLIGGAMGVGLALLAGVVFNSLDVGIKMIFSTASIVGAFAVSSTIGIVFGFVPARNAARLDPVNALARE